MLLKKLSRKPTKKIPGHLMDRSSVNPDNDDDDDDDGDDDNDDYPPISSW